MKNLLILLVLVVFQSCNSSNNYNLSTQQETDFLKMESYFRKCNLRGSIYVNNKEVRDSSATVINLIVPDYIYELSNENKIIKIVVEPNFTYFVIDGFKGKNFGILLTLYETNTLSGFYDIQKIRKCNIGFWYFASSNLW